MAKKRILIPKADEKRAYQETSSACAFCRESEISCLEIHHIDGDPANNQLENLLVVCGSCHGKITSGIISEADVVLQKRMAMYGALKSVHDPKETSIKVNVIDSTFKGDIAHTITKISTPNSPKIRHPVGSVGANLKMKGYIDYLISRYYEYREADSSYGQAKKFSYAVLHKNIQRKIGYKTFFAPEEHFEDIVDYLTASIDRTIQGKRNKSQGIPNYHSYKEHGKLAT